MNFDRVLFVTAALCGAAGVALSAASSHGGSTNVAVAANFLLIHAPALLALSLVAGGKLLRAGALVLIAGLLLFAGDLLVRDYLGQRLFPFAAPIGGAGMILGWLMLAVGGLLARKG